MEGFRRAPKLRGALVDSLYAEHFATAKVDIGAKL